MFDNGKVVGDCSLLNITIEDDLRLEGDESLSITLLETAPPAPAVVLTQTSASVLIRDNDSEYIGHILQNSEVSSFKQTLPYN